MADLASKIRYLRDCYLADNRGGGVYSLLAPKIEHCRFLSRERLLSSLSERIPLYGQEIEVLARAASLYRREKSLLYMAFPIVGRRLVDGPGRTFLCAPLLVVPAVLTKAPKGRGGLSLRLELADWRLNMPGILAFVGGEEPVAERLAGLLDWQLETPLAWEDVFELVGLLEEVLPDVDAKALHRLPQLCERDEVEKAVRAARRKDSGLRCLNACALGLVPRPLETRGILSELGQLASREDHSLPLRTVLGDVEPAAAATAVGPKDATDELNRVPAVLSAAQTQILEATRRRALSVAIGPPGTGKSFTIAAVALDQVSRGRSVLIAARRQQVLKVVEDKIALLLGAPSFAMQAGRSDQLKRLKRELEDLLGGASPLRGEPLGPTSDLRRALQEYEGRLAALEGKLARRSDLEQRLGRMTVSPEDGFLKAVRRAVMRPGMRLMLNQQGAHWRLLAEYEAALDLRVSHAAKILRGTIRDRIVRALDGNREALVSFMKALRARHSGRQDKILARVDLGVLLHTFPLWTVTFASAYRALPQTSGLFDLVIIDEATQCDLASCLPVIDRGKNLLITGDPRQLRHVSFLSRARQGRLAQRHGLDQREHDDLDFRDRSLLDRVSETLSTQQQVGFLDEHYRGAPELIAFSNREFYRGRLRVMTDRPSTVRRRGLELRRVAGRRSRSGANPEEANELVAEVKTWVAHQEGLPEELCHSLGVLSPFRAQVEHLAALLNDQLALSCIERHDLLIGTAYAFQGEERDVMFISLTVDSDSPLGSFIFLNRPDVFNVAVTRARDRQIVFCSLAPEDVPAGSFLRRYLEEIDHPPARRPVGEIEDAFQRQVAQELTHRGYSVWPAFPVAGMPVDLVIERDGRTLGIDLVGYPGAFAPAFDLERYRMLKRAGLTVFPLPFSAWQENREHCLYAIELFPRLSAVDS
ncbi:MAG: hypothetical protein D6696_06370 [Acidobacteria bacterium]|nr:MAG: hypothetical protein D6696_06370 [Acidobacteriota bacterium]